MIRNIALLYLIIPRKWKRGTRQGRILIAKSLKKKFLERNDREDLLLRNQFRSEFSTNIFCNTISLEFGCEQFRITITNLTF